MKVLVIEDDKNKLTQIRTYLDGLDKLVVYDFAMSYQSALNKILNYDYKLIILDMSLPNFDITPTEDGEPFRPYGGKQILSEMKRKRIRGDVVVLTQFETFGEGDQQMNLEQLNTELLSTFPDLYKGSIYYKSSQSKWKDELFSYLKELDDD